MSQLQPKEQRPWWMQRQPLVYSTIVLDEDYEQDEVPGLPSTRRPLGRPPLSEEHEGDRGSFVAALARAMARSRGMLIPRMGSISGALGPTLDVFDVLKV